MKTSRRILFLCLSRTGWPWCWWWSCSPSACCGSSLTGLRMESSVCFGLTWTSAGCFGRRRPTPFPSRMSVGLGCSLGLQGVGMRTSRETKRGKRMMRLTGQGLCSALLCSDLRLARLLVDDDSELGTMLELASASRHGGVHSGGRDHLYKG